MHSVLAIGAGDMVDRLTNGLAASGRVREVVLVGRSARVEHCAAALSSSYDVTVHAHRLDARDPAAIAQLLRTHRPDLVLQAASLMSPWALGGRTDPLARALASAGLGVRLPLQLPVLLATMRAVRDTGYAGPVANISLPDITNTVLGAAGLAPTVGLGNVAMQLTRVRAALRAELGRDSPMPLVRVCGQHDQVFAVMQSRPPEQPGGGPWVWVGEEAHRRDELAYRGAPIAPGIVYNAITAAAALPVLLALLPGAAPLRWSTPAPFGLPGGYPVRIADGAVALDLPDGVDLAACRAMCEDAAAGDGIARIEADGTVHFTEAACAQLAPVAPELTEPFVLADTDRRAQHLLDLLGAPV